MKFINIALLFCGCVALVGCQGKIDERLMYDPNVFNQGKKAIIIMNISQERKHAFGETPQSLNFHLVNLQTNDEFKNATTNHGLISSNINNQYKNCIMMLDPGVYYLSRVDLVSRPLTTRHGNYIQHKWLTDNAKKIANNVYLARIGAFEVKAGQVLYLGKLELDDVGHLPFNIINEIDLVKANLKEDQKSDLANRLEFGKFYQKGTLIEKRGETYIFKDGIEEQKKVHAILDDLT